MLKLGLTGSIATGKSTALAAFAELGVPVLSADEVVHELYAGAAVAPVAAAFPGVERHGRIDRQALAAILIADPRRLRELEEIVHPLVRQRIAGFLAAAEAARADLAVVDVPLLFESGYDYGFDRVALTYVDPAIQRQRALSRPGMSVEKLETILARQLPQDEKRRRADYVIDTSGPIAATRTRIGEVAAALRRQGLTEKR